jgi:hypothetical protein
MNRRHALRALLAIAASNASGIAVPQPTKKMPRIGYLGPSGETAPHLLKAFQDGLAALGYVDGRSVVVEYRWTNAGNRMTDEGTLLANARELVALNVDVLAASIDPAIVAASKATRTVPIVMLNVSDPVELGLVSSLAHPGGNVTGLTRLSPDLVGKNLEILLEVVPAANRIGLLVSGSDATKRTSVANAREAAQKRAVTLQIVEVLTAQDLDAAFAKLKKSNAQALLVSDTGGGIFFHAARSDRRAGRCAAAAVDIREHGECGSRRIDVIFARLRRELSSRRRVHRQDSSWRQGGRYSNRTADAVRAGHQHEDCKGVECGHSAIAAAARRSRLRMRSPTE